LAPHPGPLPAGGEREVVESRASRDPPPALSPQAGRGRLLKAVQAVILTPALSPQAGRGGTAGKQCFPSRWVRGSGSPVRIILERTVRKARQKKEVPVLKRHG